ncbi:MAG: sulfur carrier protein ThiS [Janthinobacterium lividum]
MHILVNQQALELAEHAMVADALAAFDARPPFAVAVNGQFVARSRYAVQPLAPGDRLDIVQPVAGG